MPLPFPDLFRKAADEILETDEHANGQLKRKKDRREYMLSSIQFRPDVNALLKLKALSHLKDLVKHGKISNPETLLQLKALFGRDDLSDDDHLLYVNGRSDIEALSELKAFSQLSRVKAFLDWKATESTDDEEKAGDAENTVDTKQEVKKKRAIFGIVQNGLKSVIEKEASYDPKEHWFPKTEIFCPYMEAGGLKTVARDEIEMLANLLASLEDYCENKQYDRPLSIATFGAPGSGKSFAVKQILKLVDEEAAKAPLEYNVAQFTKVSDLAIAFHQAHDRAMGGVTPLVIFDEFDSSFKGDELGWLKYFLAPMNDGVFRDGDNVYKVGRAIFLFAGGTKHTFKAFAEDDKDDPKYIAAKGPDFVSRLGGHLNIPDANVAGEIDEVTMFQRAVLLRSLLEARAEWILSQPSGKANMDDAVIDAFLRTRVFKHGIRSMERIIDMSRTSLSNSLRKSALPPEDQLEMHVDAKEFLKLVDQYSPESDLKSSAGT